MRLFVEARLRYLCDCLSISQMRYDRVTDVCKRSALDPRFCSLPLFVKLSLAILHDNEETIQCLESVHSMSIFRYLHVEIYQNRDFATWEIFGTWNKSPYAEHPPVVFYSNTGPIDRRVRLPTFGIQICEGYLWFLSSWQQGLSFPFCRLTYCRKNNKLL